MVSGLLNQHASIRRFAACLAAGSVWIGLWGCAGGPVQLKSRDVTVAPIRSAEVDRPQVKREELQSEVMRFADRYVEVMNQEAERIAAQSSSPELRRLATGWKLVSLKTAADIAVGPNPVENLLDMLVLATRTRQEMENYWIPEVIGEELGKGMLAKFRLLEDDIWGVSKTVLTETQRQDLRALIREWTDAHPDQHHFWGARFSGFAGQRAARLEQVEETGGLMGQVQQTRQTVDEVKDLGERLLYYMNRASSIVRLEQEFAVYSLLRQPEFAQLLDNLDQVSQSTARMVELAEVLPERRLEAVSQLMEGLTLQREAFLRDLLTEETRVRGLLSELRETLLVGQQLMTTVNGTVLEVGRLTATLDTGGEPAGPPTSIEDYRALVGDATDTATELRLLVASLNKLIASPALQDRVPVAFEELALTLDRQTEQIVTRTFLYFGLLMLFFFLLLLVYRFAVRKL